MSDLRNELIQVAAVAVAIVEWIDEGEAHSDGESSVQGFITRTDRALVDVAAERGRQDDKWGPQSHDAATWLAILGEEVGEACQAFLDDTFGGSNE